MLRDELERERTLNADLTKSTALWIRLYEEQLMRANELTEPLPADAEGARS